MSCGVTPARGATYIGSSAQRGIIVDDPSILPPASSATTASSMPPQRRARFGGLFRPFGVRNFRLLFGGQVTSLFGDNIYAIAVPWYMLSHGGAQALGILLFAYGAPRVVTIAIGGALADKFRPRRVMLVADAVRTVLTAVFAAMIVLYNPQLWQLSVVSAGLGLFSGLFLPASSTMVPDILPDEQLQAGNSLSATSMQLASLVGPAAGGLIVAFFAPWIGLAVDAATFFVSAATLLAMRMPGRHKPTGEADASPLESAFAPEVAAIEAAVSEMPGGQAASPESPQVLTDDEPRTFWQLLSKSQLLRSVLLVSIISNLALGGLVEVVFPKLIKTTFHGSATDYGVVLATFAVGALVGGLGSGLLGRLPFRGVFLGILWFGQAVTIGMIPYAGGIVGAGVMLALMGLFNGSSNVFAITAIQQRMPRALLGRVMSALMLTSLGFAPLSYVAAGFLVPVYGPVVLFPASGVLMAAGVVFALSQREIRSL